MVVVVQHLLRLLGDLGVAGLAPGVMLDALCDGHCGAQLLLSLCVLSAAQPLVRWGAAGKGCSQLGAVQGRSLAALGAVLHLLADREPQARLLPQLPLSFQALQLGMPLCVDARNCS